MAAGQKIPSSAQWMEGGGGGSGGGGGGAADFSALGIHDYVISGIVYPATGPNLTLTVTAGTAFVAGKFVAVPARTYTYLPNLTTVEDLLSDGTVVRTTYAQYSQVPATPPVGLRLAMVVAGATVPQVTDLTVRLSSMFREPRIERGLIWQKLLTELEVTTGAYTGAYRYSPNNKINWYFANVGLWFFVHLIPNKVKAYMNAYIANCDQTYWWIKDIDIDASNNLIALVHPDSTDSYAATFLKLAVRYVKVTGDWAWWNANLFTLKNIAYYNIRTQFKASSPGLVRTFSSYYTELVYDVAFLMDNSEVYAGMDAFAGMLEITGDAEAAAYRGDVNGLVNGIGSLYNVPLNRWHYADDFAPIGTAWYPDLTAQIFPELLGWHTATPLLDATKFNFGYEWLNANSPQWWERRTSAFPWLLIGYYVISKKRDVLKAAKMLDLTRREMLLAGGANPGVVTIAELGFVEGIQQGLSSPFGNDGAEPIPNVDKTFVGGIRAAGGSAVLSGAALATTARSGFAYLPTCPGVPTGVPIVEAGTVPWVVDSVNNDLYGYINGAWRGPGSGGPIADSQLTSNIARLNTAQTWTASQVYGGGFTVWADGIGVQHQATTAGGAIYQVWYNSAGARRGYLGFAGGGSSNFYIVNEEAGDVLVYAHNIFRARFGIAGGTLYGAWVVSGEAAINGKAAVADIAAPAVATDLATVITLANSMRTRLISFGLYT